MQICFIVKSCLFCLFVLCPLWQICPEGSTMIFHLWRAAGKVARKRVKKCEKQHGFSTFGGQKTVLLCCMVRAWGLEPQRLAAREPKSRMSANSIMPANTATIAQLARRGKEKNRKAARDGIRRTKKGLRMVVTMRRPCCFSGAQVCAFFAYLMNQRSMSTLPLMPGTLPLDVYCHMAKS